MCFRAWDSLLELISPIQHVNAIAAIIVAFVIAIRTCVIITLPVLHARPHCASLSMVVQMQHDKSVQSPHVNGARSFCATQEQVPSRPSHNPPAKFRSRLSCSSFGCLSLVRNVYANDDAVDVGHRACSPTDTDGQSTWGSGNGGCHGSFHPSSASTPVASTPRHWRHEHTIL